MKFKNILNEIFADKSVIEYDYYVIDKKRKEEQPNIIQNGLNDINIDGTLKKRKRGEIR
jgi:hypothetical protein